MYATPRVRLTAVLLGALLAGCTGDGGRGSSGFDITENFIISTVLETQQCVTNDDLTFCPADKMATATPTAPVTSPTPTAVVSPTATATVNAPPLVVTGLADGALITCTREGADAPCNLSFSFAGFGFPAGASFRVASRLRNPDAAWMLAAPPALDTGVDPPMLISAVSVSVPVDAADPRLQFAVLVFLTPPAALPAQFVALAETGTDFAFVTAEFELEVITIEPPATPTAPTATPTLEDATPSPTASAPTPTATATPPALGPLVTYLGLSRADSVPLAPSDFDPQGRPIYIRPFGSGLSIVVEGRSGTSGRAVGHSAYDESGGLPDLQTIISRPLGDGSVIVCDRMPPTIGGVPATIPFEFSTDAGVVNGINDLGCRVDDGTGRPQARGGGSACTLDRTGDYSFVDATSTAQFCLPIASQWAFPRGETLVAARLRDDGGLLGPAREMVVRVVSSTDHSPTPVISTPVTPPASSTPVAATPVGSQPTASFTATVPSPTGSLPPSSPTPPLTPTPSPTLTPRPGEGPLITHLGLARADDRPIAASGTDESGRPVYRAPLGLGIELVIEAAPGSRGRPVGYNAYSDVGLPDLQMILSRPLGNGSVALCDIRPPLIGGVPATDPLVFSDDPTVNTTINDLGCRVNDGTGQATARRGSGAACTVSDAPSANGFAFVNPASSVQYCLPIALAWAFPDGDTVVAARVRDVDGRMSAVREIVVRVGR